MSSDLLRRLGVALVLGCGLLSCSTTEPTGGDLAALAPDELRAEALGQTAVRLLWRRVNGEAQYSVERRDSIGGAFVRLAVTGSGQQGDTLVYLDTSVEPDRVYGYRVAGTQSSSSFSVVAGVRTPPVPSIGVRVSTTGLPTFADPDGYRVTVSGPDTVSKRATVFFPPAPVQQDAPQVLFSPLRPGLYTVRIDDLAANCGVGEAFDPQAERVAAVTDAGITTRREVEFNVVCENPRLASLTIVASVRNGVQSQALEARVSSATQSPPILTTLSLPGSGGSVSRRQLSPGEYQVDLRNLRSPCQLVGGAVRNVTLAAGRADTVQYEVDCAQAPNGTFDPTGTDCQPGRPDAPFRFRLVWSSASVAPGQEVTASLRAERGTGALPLGGGQLTIDGFATGPFDIVSVSPGADNTPTFGATRPPVNLSFVSTSLTGLAFPAELAVIRLRARATAPTGRFCTRSSAQELVEPINQETYPVTNAIFLSDPIDIATGGGSGGGGTGGGGGGTGGGGGGGTTPLPPVAVIGGPASLTAQTGIAQQLLSTGSTDPAGGTLTYLWTLPGSTTPTATVANPTVIYQQTGTYPISLQVRNAAGVTASASKNIIVVPATQNEPPIALIDGPATLTATLGQPLVVTANGSRDPDGTIQSYSWTFPGGSPSTGSGVAANVTYSAPGTYAITLAVQDDRGGSASATKSVTVAAPPESRPFVLTQTFSPVVGDTTTLTIRLDLSTNLPQTPAVEAWRRVLIGTLAWDPAVLRPDALLGVDGLNSGPLTFPEASLGRISNLNANVILGGRSGVTDVFRIRFRVLSPGGQTRVVANNLSVLPTPEAGAGIIDNYAPFTRVEDGVFPPTGVAPPPPPPPAPTTGTVQGTVTRSGTGTQSLAGTSVVVTPASGSAVTAATSGSGASVTFAAAGVPAGSGTVAVTGVPAGCTAASSVPFSGLVGGGSVSVALVVNCTAGTTAPTSARLRMIQQFGAVSGGVVDLTTSFDPSGCDPLLNAACPAARAFAGAGATITFGDSATAARITGRAARATANFGAATLGGTLPVTVFSSVTTVIGGFTAREPISIIRLTLGAGPAGTLTTRTTAPDISNPDGDNFTLVESGAGANYEVIEATVVIP